MWRFVDLWFADTIFFAICGLKTSASPQIHIFPPYILYIAYKASIKILKFVHNKKPFEKTTFRTVLRQSCADFCTNVQFFYLRISYKFADLRFADWPTKEICGFAKRKELKNLRTLKKVCLPSTVYRKNEWTTTNIHRAVTINIDN
jgi:hypothetical protein